MAKLPVRITRDLTHPETAGTHYRIICMTGKNKGLCYYLRDIRAIMGRSNQADIQVMDTQASREHLEIVRVGDNYVLTDLGSQNGVMVNDLSVKQHKLKNGDKIIIGSTVFKYGILDILPVVIDQEEDDEDEEEEEEVEVKKKKRKKKKAPQSPEEKRKKLIYIVAAVAGVLMFLPTDDAAPVKKKKTEGSAKTAFVSGETKRVVRSDLEKEIRQKVDAYIHRGRREAREKNYFRAMEEFSLALMLDPSNGDAAFHMNKAKQRLDEKVEFMFVQATKSKDSLKYNSALGTYCAIYKLLRDYPEDKRFLEAKKSVEDIAINKIGMDQSENYCF